MTDVDAPDGVIVRRHLRALTKVEGRMNGALSPGLRQALKQALIWNQIVHKYPWAVMWLKGGKRYRKKFQTLGGAIAFQQRAVRVAPSATVVSLSKSYDIPAALRGRLPKRWRWCPRCMKPRRFKRKDPLETFYVNRKEWSEDHKRYIPHEREIAVIECPLCGCTNRDTVFRRSNQPWEIRRIKPGKMRIRKRRRRARSS
jgi:hypothetical protein